jgi:hypothetical protein
VSTKELPSRDDHNHGEVSPRVRTIVKGHYHTDRVKNLPADGMTEKDNEIIKNSMGVTQPLKLERV